MMTTERDTKSDRQLWRAVMLQALLDASGQARSLFSRWPDWKHRAIRTNALGWLQEDNPDFMTVCTLADIDPALITGLASRLRRREKDALLMVAQMREHFYRQNRAERGQPEI